MASVAAIGLIALVGAIAGFVGVAAYVILPARAGFAERNYASLRNAIAMLVLAAILANLVQLPILLSDPSLMGDSLTSSSSVDPFSLPPIVLFVAITSLQIFLVAIVYVRIIAPGVMNWAALGLVGHNFRRNLWIGVIAWILLLGASFALSAGIGCDRDRAEPGGAVFGGQRRALTPVPVGALGRCYPCAHRRGDLLPGISVHLSVERTRAVRRLRGIIAPVCRSPFQPAGLSAHPGIGRGARGRQESEWKPTRADCCPQPE